MNRRLFIRTIAATTVITNPWCAVRAKGNQLPKTPRDYEGPYYPVGPQNHTNDLILGEPRDRTAGERWSDFLYWGEAQSGVDGRFEIRTYVPGDYGRRPPHIHFKIWSNEKTLLTSQVYFSELGGPRDAVRSKAAADRQTVRLIDVSENVANAELQVVI